MSSYRHRAYSIKPKVGYRVKSVMLGEAVYMESDVHPTGIGRPRAGRSDSAVSVRH